jgi:hypothetical protein
VTSVSFPHGVNVHTNLLDFINRLFHPPIIMHSNSSYRHLKNPSPPHLPMSHHYEAGSSDYHTVQDHDPRTRNLNQEEAANLAENNLLAPLAA